MQQYTPEDAQSALGSLDPGVAREDWVKIGMAMHAAGLTVKDFIAWSSTAGNFDGDRDCRQVWKSFRPGAIGAGTLYHLARENGWEPASRSADTTFSRRPQRTAPSEQTEDPKRADAAAIVKKHALLAASHPASPHHPYLLRKRVGADGLLAIDFAEAVKILGYIPTTKRGALVGPELLIVPLHLGDGVPAAVELIDPDGRKAGMAGVPRAGVLWESGPLDSAERIGICEGVVTAKTCAAALDIPVVAAGACNNLMRVARTVRERAPGAEILLLADLGNGLEDAMRAADAVIGVCIAPDPTVMAEGDTDFNDMARGVGNLDAVTAWIEAHATDPRDVTLAQARTRVVIDYVLPGLPVGRVGLMVGPGGVGKSFLAVELAYSIAMGRSLPGIPGVFETLKPGRAAVVLGEDSRDVTNNRMHSMLAAFRIHDRDVDALDRAVKIRSLVGEDMRLVQVDQRSILPGSFVEHLRHLCSGRRAVFLDPLIRLHDSDENDNTAASHLMLTIERIAKDTGCAIILLHHVGKGDRDGWAAARGASAITTSARWQLNMFPPTKDEIESLHLGGETVARRYVKCTGVKINYGSDLNHFWLRRDPDGVLLHVDPTVTEDNPFPGLPAQSSKSTVASSHKRAALTPNYPRGLRSPLVDDD